MMINLHWHKKKTIIFYSFYFSCMLLILISTEKVIFLLRNWNFFVTEWDAYMCLCERMNRENKIRLRSSVTVSIRVILWIQRIYSWYATDSVLFQTKWQKLNKAKCLILFILASTTNNILILIIFITFICFGFYHSQIIFIVFILSINKNLGEFFFTPILISIYYW